MRRLLKWRYVFKRSWFKCLWQSAVAYVVMCVLAGAGSAADMTAQDDNAAGTSSAAHSGSWIQVKGLFPGSGAVLVVNGKMRSLKVGKRSPEGVLLIAVDKKTATVEVDGKRRRLGMSREIFSGYKVAEKAVARIRSGAGGHYLTPGRINGRPVSLMVDTGATVVMINQPTAKGLGIDYQAGKPIMINTANGVAKSYLISLDSVRVGDVEVRNVEAAVSTGDFPTEILLGNSYLSRVTMKRDNGVLVLESQL